LTSGAFLLAETCIPPTHQYLQRHSQRYTFSEGEEDILFCRHIVAHSLVRAITSTSQGEVNTNCSRGTIHMAAKIVAIKYYG
jgi:hypothetical protein